MDGESIHTLEESLAEKILTKPKKRAPKVVAQPLVDMAVSASEKPVQEKPAASQPAPENKGEEEPIPNELSSAVEYMKGQIGGYEISGKRPITDEFREKYPDYWSIRLRPKLPDGGSSFINSRNVFVRISNGGGVEYDVIFRGKDVYAFIGVRTKEEAIEVLNLVTDYQFEVYEKKMLAISRALRDLGVDLQVEQTWIGRKKIQEAIDIEKANLDAVWEEEQKFIETYAKERGIRINTIDSFK